MSFIEIRGLSKSFGKNKVLDNVDLDIDEGEVVAIIGPSGTGKSTLLRSLNLLEKPESGTVTIETVSIGYQDVVRQICPDKFLTPYILVSSEKLTLEEFPLSVKIYPHLIPRFFV